MVIRLIIQFYYYARWSWLIWHFGVNEKTSLFQLTISCLYRTQTRILEVYTGKCHFTKIPQHLNFLIVLSYISQQGIFSEKIQLNSKILLLPSYNLVLPVFDCIIFIFVFQRYGVIVDQEAFLKIFGREALPIKYKS